jgi:hypothetical protein
MSADLLQEGHENLNKVPSQHLSEVVRWLKLIAATKDNPDSELEDMWLLATGELKKMADEAENEAEPLEDWRKYLNEI